MNLFADAIAWIVSTERLTGSNPLPELIGQHLVFTVVALVIAATLAVPLGWAIGHTGRGRELVVGISGAARALPSFGLILLLVLVAGYGQRAFAAYLALVLLAVPPLLAGAYAGVQAVDRRVVDAARAVGMTERQILFRVEVPLSLPLLIGGLRSAALQVVATVTIAAYANLGGLGLPIIQGIALRDYSRMLGSALIIVALALIIDAIIATVQRLVTPAGVALQAAPAR